MIAHSDEAIKRRTQPRRLSELANKNMARQDGLPADSRLGDESILDNGEKSELNDDTTTSVSRPPSAEEFLPPLHPDGPSFTTELSLRRGLQVPSRSEYFTSGFAYPAVLAERGVSQRHWGQFTQEITKGAKLSRRQWTTTVGKGLGVLAIGGLVLGVLGAVPAFLVGRKARRNREEENFIAAASDVGSDLSRKIKLWNETFFQPRGILIRVDLPYEALPDLAEMHLNTELPPDGARDDNPAYASPGRSLVGRLKIPSEQTEREAASCRARIVIIPLSKSLPESSSAASEA